MKSLKLIERNLVYKAHRVEVYEDSMLKPDGEIVKYDFVHNRNGAGILLVDKKIENGQEKEEMIFVKQYRTTVDALDIEIPAGCQNYPQEDFKICALREAEEETGYIPERMYYLTKIIAAVGLFDEQTAIYIGTDLRKGEINRDPDEFIEIIRMTPEEALKAVYDNKIIDSKTIIAIFAYNDMKSKGLIN
ncbi:ADP-ribose pyrophosphatase [Eubacterium ruminantium]|nr:ADP-ribose pyrophosphatase [Eubacterium ruminantium]